MVFEKKLLSKVVAIFMIVACALAFMPLLNGSAFAAAKKPAKVTVKKATVSGTSVKVTWKKAKNAKKYNVKIDKKVVKKNVKKTNVTIKGLAEGSHKVYVQGVNGKKKGAWSKAKSFKVKATTPAAEKTAVTAVTIDKASPVVGDTLNASVTPADATVVYTWTVPAGVTASTAAAQEATAEGTYIISVTGTGNYTGTTSAAVKVVKIGELAKVEVTGMTGKSDATKDADTPVIGDELTAAAYDAAGNAIPAAGVTYQWYRGESLLAGAATATYTVKNTDAGKTLKVVATPVDGAGYGTKAVEYAFATDKTVKTDISGYTVTLSKTSPAVGEEVEATVKNGEKVESDGFTYQWYRDDEAIANAAAAKYTAAADDVGKALSVKITGKAENGYIGTASSEKTTAVTTAISIVQITGDNGTGYGPGVTLTAQAYSDSDTKNKATATYEWRNTTTNKVLSTAQTYTINPDEAAGDDQVNVWATGTGSYTGTKSATAITVEKATEISVAKINDAAGKEVDEIVVGDTITAVTAPEAAGDKVTYQWYRSDTKLSGKTETGAINGATGATYTVADADLGKYLAVVITLADSKDTTYTLSSDKAYKATTKAVKTAITGAEIIIDNDGTGYAIGDSTTTKPADYAKTNALVGSHIHVKVSPAAAQGSAEFDVYRDKVASAKKATETSVKTKDAEGYNIKESDVGHKLIVVVKGAGSYGGEVTLDPTETVTAAVGTLSVTSNNAYGTGENQTVDALAVGDTLTATASGADFEWTVDGAVVGNEASLKLLSAYYGKAVSVKATPQADKASGDVQTKTYDAWAAKPTLKAVGYANKEADAKKGAEEAAAAVNPSTSFRCTDASDYMYWAAYDGLVADKTYYWVVTDAEGKAVNTENAWIPKSDKWISYASFITNQHDVGEQCTTDDMKNGAADGDYTVSLYAGNSADADMLLATGTFKVNAKGINVSE